MSKLQPINEKEVMFPPLKLRILQDGKLFDEWVYEDPRAKVSELLRTRFPDLKLTAIPA